MKILYKLPDGGRALLTPEEAADYAANLLRTQGPGPPVVLEPANPYANKQYETHGGTDLVETLYRAGRITLEQRNRKLWMLRIQRKLKRKR